MMNHRATGEGTQLIILALPVTRVLGKSYLALFLPFAPARLSPFHGDLAALLRRHGHQTALAADLPPFAPHGGHHT